MVKKPKNSNWNAVLTDRGSKTNLGLFSTPDLAHQSWKTAKLGIALERKPEMDDIDLRIYPNVVDVINRAE